MKSVVAALNELTDFSKLRCKYNIFNCSFTGGRGLFMCDFRPSGAWGGSDQARFSCLAQKSLLALTPQGLATPTAESSTFHVGHSAGRRGDFRTQCRSRVDLGLPAYFLSKPRARRVHTHLSSPPVGHTYPWDPSPKHVPH